MNESTSREAVTTSDQAEYDGAREEELRTLRLSDSERDLFLKVMESPPEPTEAFKRAVIQHSELIRSEEKQP